MPKWLLNCLYKLLLGVERRRSAAWEKGEKCNVEWPHFLPLFTALHCNATIIIEHEHLVAGNIKRLILFRAEREFFISR